MKKNENRNKKPVTKKTGKKGGATASKRTSKRRTKVAGKTKQRVVKLDTKQVRSKPKPRTKVSKSKNVRSKSTVTSKRDSSAQLEKELQALFLKQIQAREKRKRSRKKKGKKSNDKQVIAKDTHSKVARSSVRPAHFAIRKKRGQNLLIISSDSDDTQEIVLGIWNSKKLADRINEFLRKGIPNKVYLILGVRKPEGDIIYRTYTSAVDESMSNRESILQFIAQTISDYNNDIVEMIMNEYDQDDTDPWPIVKMALRFSYPK